MATASRNGTRRAARREHAVAVASVAIYARVSTEDQAERETIQTQLDFLRRYVDLHELGVAGEYVDDGISGQLPLHERPDGRRLLQDAESGRFGVVLVYNVKRLGRRLQVVLDAHAALGRRDVAIRSGTEPIDTATPTGKLVFHMLGSFAEFDTDERTELLSLGRGRVAASGRYTGGPIPFGYALDADRHFVPSSRLVPQLGISEAALVQQLFARVAAGHTSVNAEAERLTALGVETGRRYGGAAGKVAARSTQWRASSLTKLLHNPAYKGEGRLVSRYAGEVTRPLPPLIDAATWQRAQAAMLERKRLSPGNATRTYLLRGLVKCAGCGLSYVGSTSNGGVPSYRCAAQTTRTTGRARHDGKVLRADWLEAAVWEECRRFIRNPGDALDEARARLRQRLSDAAGFDERRRVLGQQLAGKERERERVLTLFRRGTISDAEAERELDAIASEAGQLRERIESLRAQTALVEAQEAFLTDSTALLGRLQDELAAIDASNDVARKRDVIERYVRQITVETRRVAPRRLEADVRVFLRLRPEPIAVETSRPWPKAQDCTHHAIEIERLLLAA